MAIPSALLSDKAAEDDRLGFTALENLTEPDPDPEPAASRDTAGPSTKSAEHVSSIASDPARAAEVDAMGVSNRRFMMTVTGIMVGLIAIIGFGLLTLERTLRQERPNTPPGIAARAGNATPVKSDPDAKAMKQDADARRLEDTKRAAEQKRIVDDTKRTSDAQRAAAEAELARQEDARRVAEQKQIVAETERKRRDEETRRAADAKRAEAEALLARQEEAGRVAEQRKITEAAERKRRDDEARQAADAKRVEAEALLARQEETRRVAEQKRIAEETERKRIAEEKRVAADEEKRRQDAAKLGAEQQRRAEESERRRRDEEAKRAAEEKRMADEAERRQLEDARRAAEQKRLAEDAERRRLDDTRRATEEQRLLEAAERRRQEAARRADEQKRLADETERRRQEEAKRIADARQQADLRRQAEDGVRRADQQRQQSEQRITNQVAGEIDRDSLLRIAAQHTAQRASVDRRLVELGYLKIPTSEGDVWRKPGGGEAFRDCSTCPAMSTVPAGEFLMGSPASEIGRQEDEDDTPGPGGGPVLVAIPQPFAVSRFEVTRGQFASFVTETGHKMDGGCYVRVDAFELFPELSWQSPGFPQDDEHPVACVSWLDAQAYVAWLTKKTGHVYRLLSEAEWEYAARSAPKAVVQPRFPFGNDDKDLCAFANGADLAAQKVYPRWQVASCNDGYDHTAPVGSFEPNTIGLYDMLGNLWEWTQDCYADSYKGLSQATPIGGAARSTGCNNDLRVLRGGSWSDRPDSLRPASRIAIPGDKRIQIGGFRIARTLDH